MRIKLHCGRTVSFFLSFFSSSFRRIESLSSIMNYRLNNEVNESLTASNLNFSFALEIDESLDPFLPRQRGGRTGAWRALHLLERAVCTTGSRNFRLSFPPPGERKRWFTGRAKRAAGAREEREREREPGRAGTGVPTTIAYSVDEEGTIGRRARATGTVNAQNSAWCQ